LYLYNKHIYSFKAVTENTDAVSSNVDKAMVLFSH